MNEEDKMTQFQILKDVNHVLVSQNPQLYLMFTATKEYDHESIPGYFVVPYDFTAPEL